MPAAAPISSITITVEDYLGQHPDLATSAFTDETEVRHDPDFEASDEAIRESADHYASVLVRDAWHHEAEIMDWSTSAVDPDVRSAYVRDDLGSGRIVGFVRMAINRTVAVESMRVAVEAQLAARMAAPLPGEFVGRVVA